MRVLYSRNIADRIIKPCADPGIFARGPRPDSQKTALTTFFWSYFTVLQRVSNGYFKENYIFLRFQRGSNVFQGGGGGGVSGGWSKC